MDPIVVSFITKSYGSLKAVDGISFSVREGEVFSLLGPNGAGKTTTVEILEGLRERDGGEVSVLGQDPWRKGYELHKRIGVIPQNFSFFPKANPREAINYYASMFGQRVDADVILKEVLLDDSARTLFDNLSGGQRQKTGLALALVNSPELLFLDEPTTGLDPSARRAVWHVIRRLKGQGKTILLTTHYLEEAQQLSDRVAIMDKGHIIAIGTPDEIIKDHGSGERLEVCGDEKLAEYLKDNTKLRVEYDGEGLITIPIDQEHDVMIALATIEESGLDWTDFRTRRDSLEDVFIKLIGGTLDQGDIKASSGAGSNTA
jgi:ABC-2 type transport system ATP-binding protein